MNSLPSFQKRSNAPEWMDDLTHPTEEINQALADIKKVNRWLGGHRVSMHGLKPFLRRKRKTPLHILDMGCGNGEFLRHLGRYCNRQDIPVSLTGWDRNPRSLEWGEQHDKSGEIRYECRDILSFPPLPKGEVVIVCNLFLHHFTDAQILETLKTWRDMGCRAIVVNDLHRNPLAYYLFHVFGFIFRLSRMARHDGLVSILRGFTREDLNSFRQDLGAKSSFRWRWAFRYLWVLDFK
ncbi:MAG: methyltransferase domain-containing protein [Robiginitalea sp.]